MLTHALPADEFHRKVYMFDGEITFDLPERYVPKMIVGRGSYGFVCSATDSETGETVAIKKLTNLFDDTENTKRVLREIKILKYLNHPNIMRVFDLLPPRPFERETFRELYIVSNFVSGSLSQLYYLYLTTGHIQYITTQVLSALRYMHHLQLVHRDVKPANVLVDGTCLTQLCDFGLSRALLNKVGEKPHSLPTPCGGPAVSTVVPATLPHDDEEDEECSEYITHYVFTRHYRAPELILGNTHGYDYSVDVWAVGCMVAEMVTGRTLFPGKDYVNQITCIASTLGYGGIPLHLCSPSARRYLTAISSKLPMEAIPWESAHPELRRRFFDQSFYEPENVEGEEPMPMTAEEMQTEYDDFAKFLSSLLEYDPSKRLTAEQALSHAWLQYSGFEPCDFDSQQPPFRFPEDEPVRDENTGHRRKQMLNFKQLRKLLLDEVDDYQKKKSSSKEEP